MKIVLVLIVSLLVIGCSTDQAAQPTAPVDQAPSQFALLTGSVEFWEGDFMPLTDPSLSTGEVRPVIRTVCIHEITSLQDVEPDGGGGFFSTVKTELIGTVQSDADGQFEIELAPGRYSVFVMEHDRPYANLTQDGYIQPVTVVAGDETNIIIKIDYAATY